MPSTTQIGNKDKKVYAYDSDDLNKIKLEDVIADNIRLKIKDNMDNTKIKMQLPINIVALLKLFDNYNIKFNNE